MNKMICGILLLFSGCLSLRAQVRDTVPLKDIMGVIFGEKKEDTLLKSRKERKIEIGALPYVAASPSSGFKFGVASNFYYRLGSDSITRKSAGLVSLAYTTKKQLFFYLRDLTFLPRNRWAANVDIRYNNNNEKTYGLGNTTPSEHEELLEFNTIRSNISLMRRITDALYIGGGVNYNRYYGMKGYAESFEDPYYFYNVSNGIDPSESVAAGFNIAGLYDTRDNIINAYKGINVQVTYSVLMKILGSDQAWQHLWAEFRAYQSLTANHRHRLALWSYASLITTGTTPYMDLPATGYDLYSKSGRGYTIGRYRGDKLLYSELEYRVSLMRNDLLGAVAFVNATTVSSPDKTVRLFDHVSPAAGVGLRLKLNKFSRTNISIDFAVGEKGMKGFYLDISETF